MSNKRPELRSQILALREEGLSYRVISERLECNPSTVEYHLNPNAKSRNTRKARRVRQNEHPLAQKIRRFRQQFELPIDPPHYTSSMRKRLQRKVDRYHKSTRGERIVNNTFTVNDLLEKIGPNPTCYLTGEPIDLDDTRSYHLDHVIPRSRGGDCTLDNANICTKRANLSKGDMTHEEYVEHCRQVVNHADA